MAHLLDVPAGKHGFIRVENGRFVNDAGPVRLHATNLTGPANVPTHQQADKLAARLARFGINCLRLHYFDEAYGNFMIDKAQGIIADDPTTQRNLDPRQVERQDYLIAALKRRGIYVDVNLHVARWWDERDGFTGKARRPGFDKGLDNFEPRMIELQKKYAPKLLTHVNPYTGLAYTDDPCVAVIEINNENVLFNQYHRGAIDRLPDPYAAEFRRQWNTWLRKKYASTAALRDSWKWVATPLHDEQMSEGEFDRPVSLDGRKWILALGMANTKVFTGFPRGRTIKLGEVTLEIGKTPLDWATVSLVSRRATGFGESGRPANILLAATGLMENQDMVIDQVNAREITLHDKWGTGTVLAEGIPATITLPADPAKTKCFALDPNGNRKNSVPVEKAEHGGSKITIGPAYETVWYEMDLQ